MMEILLTRLTDNGEQTIGFATMYNTCKTLMQFSTLELSWKNNERNISCIPTGMYTCKIRESKKYGKHLIVENVKGRSMILIHSGNFNKDTKGCILVGERFAYIDNDNNKDLTNSKITLNRILAIMGDENELKLIINGGDNSLHNSKWDKV